MHGLNALFGALLGFMAAVAPELLQMLKDRFSHQRDLEAKQQELDAAARGYEYTIQSQSEALASKDAEIAVLQRQTEDCEDIKHHPALAFLRSSVRPILTYGFFGFFASVKLFALHHALAVEHTPVMNILPGIWDEDTESLFAAVITFWFGSRSINTFTSNKDGNSDGRHPKTTLTGSARVVGE
jgi:hypothetical protein